MIQVEPLRNASTEEGSLLAHCNGLATPRNGIEPATDPTMISSQHLQVRHGFGQPNSKYDGPRVKPRGPVALINPDLFVKRTPSKLN